MDFRKRRNSSLTRTISHVIDEVKTAEHNAMEYVKTLTWHQLEEWQKDNEYITQGYRRWAESIKLFFVWTLVDRDLDRRTAGKDVSIPSLDVRGFETRSG